MTFKWFGCSQASTSIRAKTNVSALTQNLCIPSARDPCGTRPTILRYSSDPDAIASSLDSDRWTPSYVALVFKRGPYCAPFNSEKTQNPRMQGYPQTFTLRPSNPSALFESALPRRSWFSCGLWLLSGRVKPRTACQLTKQDP